MQAIKPSNTVLSVKPDDDCAKALFECATQSGWKNEERWICSEIVQLHLKLKTKQLEGGHNFGTNELVIPNRRYNLGKK